jgi:hypothetical protein
MELNFDDKTSIIQAAQTHGHQAIIRLFKAKVDGLTQELLVPQANVDEDIRLLQQWRGYSSALYFLESLPRLIQAEVEKQQRAGTFSVSPSQPTLFGVGNIPDVMSETYNPLTGPRPVPAAHPMHLR